MRMADAIGIGKIGKNGLLFHSKYGPRLMLGGLITTASLPWITRPEKDESGCPENCFVCQDVCPVDAIERTGKVKHKECFGYSMSSPLFSGVLTSEKLSHQELTDLIHTAGVDDHAMYKCVKCLSECPRC